MATPIRIKRSAVPGKRPTIGQIDLGELAINTYDGKLFLKQDTGGVGVSTRVVEVGGYVPGKTVYVAQNGNDNNDGLSLSSAKRTIKAAVGICSSGDTVKVNAGTYVEDNPIDMPINCSIEGAELRNCLVSPQNSGEDLFWVTEGAHITDLSFVGAASTNGAAAVSFKPLVGVASDRFFDAARMIRMNLDFIASEAVGYLTSTDYRDPAFVVVDALGSPTDPTNCSDDIKDIWLAVCHDITRGGNSKCVGAGKSYYNGDVLQHIVGVKTETIDAIHYSAGIARAVINNATWGGKPVGVATDVTDATYDKATGITTITAINHGLIADDAVHIVGLGFTCDSDGGLTELTYPDGSFGYVFPVKNVVGVNTFEVVVGISTLDHYYTSGGTVQKRENYQPVHTQIKDLSMQYDPATGFNDSINSCANVVSAIYSCVGVVTTIIDVGMNASGITTNYPGNNGTINSGILTSTFSPSQGVGIVNKGPYIRNCTNFIPNSIGLKMNGFDADPGDKIDNGIQGAAHVDSYTQYNQGGIGVSCTNGAYAQLVSLFTICCDTAVYMGKGGQCDLTNSNSSFGTFGLVSEGVGDNTSGCFDRYTGKVVSPVSEANDTITISGVGGNRPYSGQVAYFGELYYEIERIVVTNGGTGYTSPPDVTIDFPTGPNGIEAVATSTINASGQVTAIDLVTSGRNFQNTTVNVTITGGGGFDAAAEAVLYPLYYKIDAATLPSAGITTVTLNEGLNNDVGTGTTVYFARQSLQIASSHSFEYIGAGNNINGARPSQGGVTIQENEVVKINGGEVIYTSTDQDGNFRIGDDVSIDQATGTISGRAFDQSLLNTVTPLIIALE